LPQTELKINSAYYEHLENDTEMQIYFGGSSSGKSRFVAQRTILDLLEGKRNYIIVRKTRHHLRDSVWKELNQVISSLNAVPYFKFNITNLTISCLANGRQLVCVGLDDAEKVKSIVPESGVFTDLWVEEATEITEDDFRQLQRRMRGMAEVPKRVTFTFNPIFREHWICQRWFATWADSDAIKKDSDLFILKTTYRDNAFLDDYEIKVLETEKDEYWRNVYTFGNWGVLGDVIFNNWTAADVINGPDYYWFDLFRHGLDFGFSNDPTAFVRLYYHKATKRLFITQEWGAKEITNPAIAAAIKPMLNGDYVVCDSAEPKSIKELQLNGIKARPAQKGPDSVIHGIQWLKQQEIIIDRGCTETIKNFQLYQWKKDPKEDRPINVPVDRANDFIDAIRYACEDLMFADEQFEIRTTKSRAVM